MTSHGETDLGVPARIPSFDHLSMVPHLPNALNDPPGAPWDGLNSTGARLGSRIIVAGDQVLMFFRGDVADTASQGIFLWTQPAEGFSPVPQTRWQPYGTDPLFSYDDLGLGWEAARGFLGAVSPLYSADFFEPGLDLLHFYFKVKEIDLSLEGDWVRIPREGLRIAEFAGDGHTDRWDLGKIAATPEQLRVELSRDDGATWEQIRHSARVSSGDAAVYRFAYDDEAGTTRLRYPHPRADLPAMGAGTRLRITRRDTAFTHRCSFQLDRRDGGLTFRAYGQGGDPAASPGSSATPWDGPLRTWRADGRLNGQAGMGSFGTPSLWIDADGRYWMLTPEGFDHDEGGVDGLMVRPSWGGEGAAAAPGMDFLRVADSALVIPGEADPDAYAHGHRVQTCPFAEGDFVYISSTGGNTRHPDGRLSNDYPDSGMVYRCARTSGTDPTDPSSWSAPSSGLLSFLRGPMDSPSGGGIWGPSIYKVNGTYYASSEHVGALPVKRTDDPGYDLADYHNDLTDWQLDLLRDDEYGGTRDKAEIRKSKDFQGQALTVTASVRLNDLRGTVIGKTTGRTPGPHDWWVEIDGDGALILTYERKDGAISLRTASGLVAPGEEHAITVALRDKAPKSQPAMALYLDGAELITSSARAIAPARSKDHIQLGSRNDKYAVIQGRLTYAAVYADWVTGDDAAADRASANGSSAHRMVRQFPIPARAKPRQALADSTGMGPPLRLSGEAYYDRRTGEIAFDGGFLRYNDEITSNSLSFAATMTSLAEAWDAPGPADGTYVLQNVETGLYLTAEARPGGTPKLASGSPGAEAEWTLARSAQFVTLSRGDLFLTQAARHGETLPLTLAAEPRGPLRQFFLIAKSDADGSGAWVLACRDTSLRLRAGEDGQAVLGYTNPTDPAEQWELVPV